MLEVVVFALVLVLAQVAASLGLMTLMFSNWFTKRLMKKTMGMTKTIVDELEKLEEKL